MDVHNLKVFLEKNYGLKIKDVIPFQAKGHNDFFKIVCEDKTYFLKSYSPYDSIKSINKIDEMALLRDALCKKGIDVLIPIKNLAEKLYVRFDGVFFELYDFVETSHKIYPFSCLTLLSNFHKAASEMGEDFPSFSLPHDYFFENIKSKRDEFLDHSDFFAKYLDVRWLDAILLRVINASSKFNLQLVHGDCHVFNFLQSDDKLFIIDLEDVQMGLKVYDLACFIPQVAYVNKDRVDLQLFLKLVSHYLEFNSLDDFERSFLFDMVVVKIFLIIMNKFIKNEDLSESLLKMRLSKHHEDYVRGIDYSSLAPNF